MKATISSTLSFGHISVDRAKHDSHSRSPRDLGHNAGSYCQADYFWLTDQLLRRGSFLDCTSDLMSKFLSEKKLD
jgi:hypothetical protein